MNCYLSLPGGILWSARIVVLSAVFVTPVAAQDSAHPSESDLADSDLEEVLIIGHPLSGEGLAQAATVLTGTELERSVQGSLGATVANQPGIHNSSFGAAVGRPVIHGLGGARVRVMEDRIDTMDVSVTSSDHATAVEPYLADRIEILKGSSTLLYGSGAIGGVVDVHTGRIPHFVPEQAITGKLDLRAADNADQRNAALRLDGGAGSFAWHVDGFARDADEYDIPGFAESAQLRAAEEAEGDEAEAEEEEEAFGFVPGSQLESNGGAIGASYVRDGVIAGIAVSTIASEYGLPGGHGHEEEEEEEEEEAEGNPLLDMEQIRVDLELAIENPFAAFDALNIRVGANDYEHQEIEPSGEVATDFSNEAIDSRFELTYSGWYGWQGAFGLQYANREFSAVGEEAFVPPIDTSNIGAYWLTEKTFDQFELEGGLRIESVEHEPSAGRGRDFTTVSASLGAVIPIGDTLSLGLLLDRSERAPVGEELYSNGAHLATQSFELGDEDLDKESAINFQATASFGNDLVDLAATAYITQFDDFIYQTPTGELEDGLDVLRFAQQDATFVGFDAELTVGLFEDDHRSVDLTLVFDTVSAELDLPSGSAANDNLPRIPASRHGLSLAFSWDNLSGNLDYRRISEQDDIAELESTTGGYDDVGAYLAYRLPPLSALADNSLELYLQGRNLTDDEQREHTSFIKDFAPRPGRSIEAGLRFEF